MKKSLYFLFVFFTLACTLTACGKGSTDITSDTSNGTSDTSSSSTSNCEHEYEDVWTVFKPAKCTTKGIETRSCKKCGDKESRYVDPVGHIEVIDEAKSATCMENGYTEGSHCSLCNKVMVAQNTIPKAHAYNVFLSSTKEPDLSTEGEATFKCEYCDNTQTQKLDKLTALLLTKGDIYSVETDQYNPAVDNAWKVFDGNKNTVGIYSAGDDWFGNEGDVLKITLKEEMVLSDLKLYVAGNWTFADVTVRNAKGQKTAEKTGINANGSAYGGVQGQEITVFSNKNVKVYTIEIKITQLKENYMTFKVAEVEIKAAGIDVRLHKDHVYREYVEETLKATCQVKGKASFACYCGQTQEKETEFGDHVFDKLISSTAVSCTTNGKEIYRCECGDAKQITINAKGHIYSKLVCYIKEPTVSESGQATFKCIGCDLTSDKVMSALPIEKVNYLRVSEIANGTVTLKFNIYGTAPSYEIRYSQNPITEDNFSSATKIDAIVSGTREMSVKISLNVGLSNGYYVAIKPYVGSNCGEIATVRVGGNGLIPIDYDSANVYHGEVLDSFEELFDEQDEDRSKAPTTQLPQIFKDESDEILYGSKLSPIVDLEYLHYISSVYLYYASGGIEATVRWSNTAIDFMADNSKWDGYYTLTSTQGWNEIKIDSTTRYIQLTFKDANAPYEFLAYGYQNGDGDKIATSIGSLPTIGEMMGMCGFTAEGQGNTPIDSLICTTVLREYRNFGWGYKAEGYPYKASFFNGGMGDFDKNYREYSQAGINIIPCIQWNLTKETVSYKVDSDNLPQKSGGKYIAADFWERFNPHTYFVYADNMFAFSARYGSNASDVLLNIASGHVEGTVNVGLNYIKWLELGNEPDGVWNEIHNYYSAYQLAALTSAGYDGHCRTMTSAVTDDYTYHLGVKNADPNMKVAMAGVSGISNEYITAMCYWMKANREDSQVALDAFNVHFYMTKQVVLQNGFTYTVGASPEESNLKGKLSNLVALRDKYYPEKEVWITEFGWDTNQSYATVTSAHAYGKYTGRQVQAMWLTRAYLLLSSMGIDKATMYMCEDTGAVENEAVGKYATPGVIGFEYNENGEKVEVKKDSYYYLYTLKNTLGNYTFNQEIEAYDENVMIYEYKTSEGKTAYAIWCKTSDGTKSDDYQLKVTGTSATLIENQYGDIDGGRSQLTIDALGYVSVDVSENPVYIVLD